MAASILRPLLAGLLLVSLVLLTIAPSAPEPWRPQTPAEAQASLARLRERLAQATSVVVTHKVLRREIAPFAATVPCRIQNEDGTFTRRLDETWVRNLLEVLQPDSFWVRRGGPACDGDSTRSDRVTLEFGTGSQSVTATVSLGSGDVTLTAEGEQASPITLGNRTAELRETLASALTADTMLAAAPVCDGERAASFRRPPAPRVGQYVYVQTLPEAIRKVPPVYPELAREAGVAGQVMVQALLGKDGLVRETMIVHSIPMLDLAAIVAVEQWEFKPAMSDGKPVAVWVAIPVKFSLK